MGGKAWKAHNPHARPLGCNGKYGSSGYKAHKRKNTRVCGRCRVSAAHYMRERRRGGLLPHKPLPKHCGTMPGVAGHRQAGEPLDFACKLAEANYKADRRKLVQEKS